MGNRAPKKSYKIEDDSAFVKDWSSGMSVMTIAEKHGIKKTTVLRNAERLGLKAPPISKKKAKEDGSSRPES